MEAKDIAVLVGVFVTAGGVLWSLARSITQGATLKDLYDLERKIEARLTIDKKDSVESHANLVTRREFEAALLTFDKRFDKLDDTMERLENQVGARIDVLDKTITNLTTTLITKGKS